MKFCTINLLYGLVLMCGSINFGAIIAYGSATLKVINAEFQISTFEYASFQSIPAMISIFGPYLFNFLLAHLRRKVVVSIIGCVGSGLWLLLLVMNKKYFWVAIIIRGFHGFILSGVSLTIPLYIAEIAPDDQKGFFSSLHPVSIALAHVMFNLIGVLHSWRYPIFVSSGFLLILGTCVWFIPDSPSDPKRTDEAAEDKKRRARESILSIRYRRNFIVSMVLMFSVQFSGIGAIMQNCSPLLSEVGLTIDSGYQAAMAVSAQLFTCFISSLLIDRFGGKLLWIVSSSGTSFMLLIYALNAGFNWSKWVPMFALFGYQLSYGLGLSNVPFYIITMFFPPDVKTVAMTIGISLNWVSATIVMFSLPYLQIWLGQFGLMLVFSGINLGCSLFGAIFIREKRLKNPQLEEEDRNRTIHASLIDSSNL
ncbi:glucose import [Tritrichomonas musculus]|uniref:Glucose import n=1 Tax=Tritrichomonas musculus TaxID=1915356 RepID=A0ABR2HHE0_9EUKA